MSWELINTMNYEHGLRVMKSRLPQEAREEFLVLEARLQENLQSERLYGSTETSRAERARIVDALNRLALKHLGTTFNDLCQEEATRSEPEFETLQPECPPLPLGGADELAQTADMDVDEDEDEAVMEVNAKSKEPTRGGEPIGAAGPSAGAELEEEPIRLDVAAPEEVEAGRGFDIAVRVSRPDAPPFTQESLPKVTSGRGRIYLQPGEEHVRYRIKVSSAGCDVHTEEQEFLLFRGRDSEPIFFQLTARSAGPVSILVTAYQPGDLLAAQTRIQLTASVTAVSKSMQFTSATPIPGLSSDPRVLRKVLNEQFSADELRDLCLDLGLDYENIAGETKVAKARELVLYLQRRGELDRLVAAIRAVRG